MSASSLVRNRASRHGRVHTRTWSGPRLRFPSSPHYRRCAPSSLALGRRIYPLYAASVRSLGASLCLLGLRLGHWHAGRNGRGSMDGSDRGSWTVSRLLVVRHRDMLLPSSRLPSLPPPLPLPAATFPSVICVVPHLQSAAIRVRLSCLHPASLPILCLSALVIFVIVNVQLCAAHSRPPSLVHRFTFLVPGLAFIAQATCRSFASCMHSRRRRLVFPVCLARFGQFALPVIFYAFYFSALLAVVLTRCRLILCIRTLLAARTHTLPCCITTAVLLVTPSHQTRPAAYCYLYAFLCSLPSRPCLGIPSRLSMPMHPCIPLCSCSSSTATSKQPSILI